MSLEIFKVQLSSTEPKMALVYNQDRSIWGQFPAGDLLNLIPESSKAFFYSSIGDNGIINIVEEAPQQSW